MELELSIPVKFTVPAKDPAYKTGIRLKKGAVYRLEVLPHQQTWTDDTLKPFTADGRVLPIYFLMKPFFRMPFVKWFALLGSIDDERSTYFKIGTLNPDYRPGKDGELVCFANDAWIRNYHYYENNDGSLEVTITRIA